MIEKMDRAQIFDFHFSKQKKVACLFHVIYFLFFILKKQQKSIMQKSDTIYRNYY